MHSASICTCSFLQNSALGQLGAGGAWDLHIIHSQWLIAMESQLPCFWWDKLWSGGGVQVEFMLQTCVIRSLALPKDIELVFVPSS